jgi:hypothetical protein
VPISLTVVYNFVSPGLQWCRCRWIVCMLELIAASWSGPVSLALYTSDADSARFLTFYTSSALLSARCNIAVHLVYAEGEFFPINHLRNVALRQVFTKKEDTGYDTVRKSYSTASVIADPGALKNRSMMPVMG